MDIQDRAEIIDTLCQAFAQSGACNGLDCKDCILNSSDKESVEKWLIADKIKPILTTTHK
jgi:hypothetical protein